MESRPIDVDSLRVGPGERLSLAERPTRVARVYDSKKQYRQLLRQRKGEIGELQDALYAANVHALLLIFQGMDASGKDSAIRNVLTGIDPLGTSAHNFKQPSHDELDHDFLWRTTRHLPGRGTIGVFNRSYYEEVLIVRVHPELLKKQNLPDDALNAPTFWDDRYQSIRDHERYLWTNGTRVVKFFLHLSQEEQRQRFLKRIDEPAKNWKFHPGDLEERGFWPDYMEAYEMALSATSTEDAPWYVIPADDKRNAHLFIAEVVLRSLRSLQSVYPKLDGDELKELQEARERLAAEAPAIP